MNPVQATPNGFDDQPTGMVDLRAIAMNTQSSLEVKPLDVAQLRPAVVAPMPMPSLFPGTEPPAQGLAAMSKGPRAPLMYGAIALAALVFLGLGAGLTAWLLAPGDSGLTAAALAQAPASEPVIVEHEVVRRSKVADASESHSTTATTATAAPRRASGNATPRRSTPPKQTAAQKKASDPCNCKGVLACAMRCTK